jgi:hypothetical protein
MRFGSKSGVATSGAPSPSGRPDIGGSGSPAPSTTRPGGVAAVPILADLARSGIAKSGLGNSGLGNSGLSKSDLADPLADPCADPGIDPCANRLGMVAFGDPAGGLGRKAALVDASGGGCAGSPAAIRCRTEPAPSGRSAPAEGLAGSEPIEAWSGLPVVADPPLAPEVLGDEPAAEEAAESRGRAASRPLPSGGAFPEFTAYPPC